MLGPSILKFHENDCLLRTGEGTVLSNFRGSIPHAQFFLRLPWVNVVRHWGILGILMAAMKALLLLVQKRKDISV